MKRFLLAGAVALGLAVLAPAGMAHAAVTQPAMAMGYNLDGMICNGPDASNVCLWADDGAAVWTEPRGSYSDTNFNCVWSPNNTCQFQQVDATHWCIGWNNADNEYLMEGCVTPAPTWQQFRWGGFTCPGSYCYAVIYNVYRGHWLYDYGPGDRLGDTATEGYATTWCETAPGYGSC